MALPVYVLVCKPEMYSPSDISPSSGTEAVSGVLSSSAALSSVMLLSSTLLLSLASVYSRYETGDRQPPIEVLIKLSETLGVTVDYIIENCNVASYAFTSYETELLSAARNADVRAKEDALMILQNHSLKHKNTIE